MTATRLRKGPVEVRWSDRGPAAALLEVTGEKRNHLGVSDSGSTDGKVDIALKRPANLSSTGHRPTRVTVSPSSPPLHKSAHRRLNMQ